MPQKKGIYLFMLLMSLCINSCDGPKSNAERIPDQLILHRVVDPQLIQQLGIKYLTIENCQNLSQCSKEEYEFNGCGEISSYRPSWSGSITYYTYDEHCILISKIEPNYTQFHYSYIENDSIEAVVIDLHEKDKSSIKYRFKVIPPDEKYKKPLHDQNLSHTTGKLVFPCGVEYEGPNQLIYTYYYNGLPKAMQVWDSTSFMVVEDVYYYKNIAGEMLHFE